MHDYTALDSFWKRYNKVSLFLELKKITMQIKLIYKQAMLEKVALDKEKESLDEENKRLKLLLKQYLDGNLRPAWRYLLYPSIHFIILQAFLLATKYSAKEIRC